MVQYEDSCLPLEANFWKLTSYTAEITDDDLRGILQSQYGCRIKGQMKRDRLLYFLSRLERGFPMYHDLAVTQLEAECNRRSITYTHATRGLVTKLEAADENLTFAPFMRLPVELRTWVYELNTSWNLRSPLLVKGRKFLPNPPICKVSKLIRRESIPIFYNTFNPELRILPVRNAAGNWISHWSTNMSRILIAPKLFKHLRRVTISLYITEYQARGIPTSGKYQYEFELLPEKRFRITTKGADMGTLTAEWTEERMATLDLWMGNQVPQMMADRTGLRFTGADGDLIARLAKGAAEGRLVMDKVDGEEIGQDRG